MGTKNAQTAIQNFLMGKSSRGANWSVDHYFYTNFGCGFASIELRLYGHVIARRVVNCTESDYENEYLQAGHGSKVTVSHRGYTTKTTFRFLNQLPGVSVKVKNFEPYINGKYFHDETDVILDMFSI